MARSKWKHSFLPSKSKNVKQLYQISLFELDAFPTAEEACQNLQHKQALTKNAAASKNVETLVNSFEKIRLWSRASRISEELVGVTLEIYQGMQWIRLRVTPEMVGHRVGEFAKTRRAGTHKKKRLK